MRTGAALAAAVAACLGAAAAAPAGAQELQGRLFFTPAERGVLENARRNKTKAEELAAAEAARPKAAPAHTVSVTGVVRRSDGESTVWVNGHPVRNQSDDGLAVAPARSGPGHVRIRLPAGGSSVELKVGQRVELGSGRVTELAASPAAQAASAASTPR